MNNTATETVTMRAASRVAAIIVICLLAASCRTYTLVEGSTTIDGAYTVDAQRQWNRWGDADNETWIAYGQGLARFTFFANVEAGETLYDIGDENNPAPAFHADMLPNEVAELLADTYRRANRNRVEFKRLRPAEFDSLDGFAFGLDYYTENGLHYRGLARGAINDAGKLHLMVFEAPAMHYFPELREEARRVLASVRLDDAQKPPQSG